MFARVTIARSPGTVEDTLKEVNERVVPQVRGLAGFKSARWVADRGNNTMVGVVVFESEEALRDSSEAAAAMRAQGTERIGVSFEVYEGEVVLEI